MCQWLLHVTADSPRIVALRLLDDRSPFAITEWLFLVAAHVNVAALWICPNVPTT